jgi:hypothetical protein
MKIKAFTSLGVSLLALAITTAEETTVKIGSKTVTSVSNGELILQSSEFRGGATPPIGWNIELSQKTIDDFMKFNDDDEPKALTDLKARVTILGTGVTSSTKNGYKSYTTKGKLKIGSNNWVTVHNGNEDAVDPGKVVYETVVKKGESLKFEAAYYNNGWKDFRANDSDEIKILLDGDAIPTNKPTNEAVSSAEDFLKPILNDDGTVDIGLMDVIYVCELTHTKKTSGGYDLQDLIVHVSFEPVND